MYNTCISYQNKTFVSAYKLGSSLQYGDTFFFSLLVCSWIINFDLKFCFLMCIQTTSQTDLKTALEHRNT